MARFTSKIIWLLVASCSSVTPVVKDDGRADAEQPPVQDTGAAKGDDAGGKPAPPDALATDAADATPDAGTVPPTTCAAPGPEDPTWREQAVGYEIFVRSFQDTDNDGIGDLKGVTGRLPYLSDLGVTLLWLMPITESPSYHGYDVTDYRAVESDYGTLLDLEELVEEAHKEGIKVVTDLVLNHSSSQHPWFLDAKTGKAAAHRDHYVWSDVALDWDRPWGPGPVWHKAGDAYYYALFWEGMPDLNFKNQAVRKEAVDIATFWLDRGVDGFRLDAARYLVETGGGDGQADAAETHAFWQELRAAVDAKSPDGLLLGEVWEQTSILVPYFGTEAKPELHMLFDFDAASGIVEAVAQGQELRARSALCKRLSSYPAWGASATFLTNHDQVRVATALAGDERSMRLAAALLLTFPGTPWIYYGEEIGMRNGSGGGDEAKRLPMQWIAEPGAGFSAGTPWQAPVSEKPLDTVAGQTDDPTSLLSLYRTLIHLRRAHPALAVGSTARVAAVGSTGAPLVLRREAAGEVVLVVASFSDEDNEVVVPASAVPAGPLEALLGSPAEAAEDGSLLLSLPPKGFVVLGGGS